MPLLQVGRGSSLVASMGEGETGHLQPEKWGEGWWEGIPEPSHRLSFQRWVALISVHLDQVFHQGGR